ncbi:MAG: YbaB/EbfC family nucleoid-associated protein [Clostridia bacterium]|nr:YbaB/EbfC family nucleoid-associated protein [Clostridia bacterium]
MNNFRGGFGGGFGGANLQNLMKQAQRMQQEMEKAKEELVNTDFIGTSGGGMVEVTMTGDKKAKKVQIKPAVVDPDDIEMLEDLIQSAINDAMDKITKAEQEKLPQMPQGF